jgi:hypothetical protein
MTTSLSETKRGRGRPAGVKNGQGVRKKKPVKKVAINMEAILANSEIKKLTAEVARLNEELRIAKSLFEGAKLHIEATEKKHKAALIVIGYLEGKIFGV